MSTKEKPPPPSVPKLVKLDKAFKLAEQWVNGMAGNLEEEPTEVDLEGRPPGLGLGAKVPPKCKAALSNDPVARKLHAKLNTKKRKSSGTEDFTPSSAKVSGDDGDDDDEEESRTNAFTKKRAVPLTIALQSKKRFK
ncbi:hypothetical protein Nepgr_015052 [Nepenthes gracilis]|uniref:Uncharacterized protein n=1 Tax=Nepenthes gracilis TaxID=150966 RepID=A0AAD3SMY5_NEPGR|nr:hypothetical protein Nepgr_015052 [Nepenthes gracilis]